MKASGRFDDRIVEIVMCIFDERLDLVFGFSASHEQRYHAWEKEIVMQRRDVALVHYQLKRGCNSYDRL